MENEQRATPAQWREECRSAYLYRALAKHEGDGEKAKPYTERAEEAERHATELADKLPQRRRPRRYHPGLRTRVVALLLRWFGPEQIYPVLVALRIRGLDVPTSAGNLRAGVFGMNDGLVSNVALIMGVAGSHVSNSVILLSGTAGLLAGACSMGAGEYISVRSQREMYENQIDLESRDLAEDPEHEQRALAGSFEERGVDAEQAESVAKSMLRDKDRAVRNLALEHLGLDPDDLGSPWGAAVASFTLFAIGAFVPLLPFALGLGAYRLEISLAITGAALLAVGATLSLFTGRNALLSGLRMLAIGGGASLVTWVIGNLIGVSVA